MSSPVSLWFREIFTHLITETLHWCSITFGFSGEHRPGIWLQILKKGSEAVWQNTQLTGPSGSVESLIRQHRSVSSPQWCHHRSAADSPPDGPDPVHPHPPQIKVLDPFSAVQLIHRRCFCVQSDFKSSRAQNLLLAESPRPASPSHRQYLQTDATQKKPTTPNCCFFFLINQALTSQVDSMRM